MMSKPLEISDLEKMIRVDDTAGQLKAAQTPASKEEPRHNNGERRRGYGLILAITNELSLLEQRIAELEADQILYKLQIEENASLKVRIGKLQKDLDTTQTKLTEALAELKKYTKSESERQQVLSAFDEGIVNQFGNVGFPVKDKGVFLVPGETKRLTDLDMFPVKPAIF